MVPLVSAVQELETVRAEVERVILGLRGDRYGHRSADRERDRVPRAALTAGEIATAAEFFSFGTNDLTQMGWGFSRDDVESTFFSRYLDLGIFGVSPFTSIDRAGVGRLVRIAVEEEGAPRTKISRSESAASTAIQTRPLFAEVGLNYISCSPFRVPVARIEAGRAAVAASPSGARSGTAAG